MGWRMHSHRLVMGVALLAGLVMVVGYQLLSGVPSSFLLVGERLQEAGYAVVYTRTSDEVSRPSDNSADLAARVETAIEAEADYDLSVHLNASVYGDGARGFEIYADPDDAEMWAMASAVEE